MYRPRLKSRGGCLECKRRKKKCDEVRPVCDACARLHLLCKYTITVTQEAGGSAAQVGLPPSQAGGGNSQGQEGLRVPDHTPTQLVDLVFDECADIVRQSQALPTLANEFSHAFDEHIAISGILFGWQVTSEDFALDDQWRYLSQIEGSLAKIGHGSVTRIAVLLYFRRLMRYLTVGPTPEVNDNIHSWLLPRGKQLSSQYPDMINYFPWPSVRAHLLDNQHRYCQDAWLTSYINLGFRFLWPFAPSQAIEWDPSGLMLQVSTEFRVRASNLRSYALGSDFLVQNPQLRGAAPQAEPSATTYRPQVLQAIEASYWNFLKQRAPEQGRRTKRKLARTSTGHEQPVAGQISALNLRPANDGDADADGAENTSQEKRDLSDLSGDQASILGRVYCKTSDGQHTNSLR